MRRSCSERGSEGGRGLGGKGLAEPAGGLAGRLLLPGSAALGPAAVGAAFAAAAVDELAAAVGAEFAGFGAVFDVAFQGACHAVLPGGDGVYVEGEFADEFYDVGDGHAVAEYAGDEFGVVPVFLVEHAGEAFDGYVVAVFVEELEVVACVFVAFFFDADDDAFVQSFRD